MTCPSAETLAAYSDASLAPPEAEEVLGHLPGCDACQEHLLLLSMPLEPEPVLDETVLDRIRAIPGTSSPFRWKPASAWIAAAVLALALALLWEGDKFKKSAPLSTSPAAAAAAGVAATPPSIPGAGSDWAATSGDAEAVFADAVHVSLRHGSVLRVGATERELLLERGLIYLETPAKAEKVSISLSGTALVVEVEEGALAVELGQDCAGLGAALLRNAYGAERVARFTAVSGKVCIRIHAKVVDLGPGESVCWKGGGQTGEDLEPSEPVVWRGRPWRDCQALAGTGVGPRTLRDGNLQLLDVLSGQDYVLEALVAKSDPRAELGISFRAGSGAWLAVAGDNRFPASLPEGQGWTRLRVEVASGWCRLSLGSRTVLSMPVAALREHAQPSPESGVSIRAWGGTILLDGARWRPVP